MDKFPFITDTDIEKFRFFRIPKVLFEAPEFDEISTDAKLVYAVLLDRTELSLKNQWKDEAGRVYIIYPVKEIAAALNFGVKKISKLLAELDDKKGIGLITRVRRGLCRPDRIYVHWCATSEMSKRHFLKVITDSSGEDMRVSQELLEQPQNDTYSTESYDTDTDHIVSYQAEPARRMDQIDYIDYFEKSLYACDLRKDNPYKSDQIDEIITLLADICSTRKEWIYIAGEERDANLVRQRLMGLSGYHIRYVIDCIDQNTSDISNVRSYLLAALYNSPTSMETYFANMVNSRRYTG